MIVDGKKIAADLRLQVKHHVGQLREKGLVPGLAVVLVGEDPASSIYVKAKGKQTVDVGMKSFEYRLEANTAEDELIGLLGKLNADPTVHGILMQLPLPRHIDTTRVINAVAPEKDVDAFHTLNVGLLSTGQKAMRPCTPQGCLFLLHEQLGSLAGLEAVVLGRSQIVGKPMAQLLLAEHCTVTVAHSQTKNLREVCRRADILVAAVGRPQIVQGDWVKPGATVIDVGINRITDGGMSRIVGDVEFESVRKIAGAITPVPGGVGPMTIACLLINTLTACCRTNGLPDPTFPRG